MMTTTARRILIAALVVGVAGDLLLRGGMWRLGFALWISLVVLGAMVVAPARSNGQRLLLAGVLAATWGLVQRDAPMLYVIDLLSVLCTGALVIWVASGRSLGELTVIETLRAALLAAVNTIAGAAGAAGSYRTAADPTVVRSRGSVARDIAKGLVLAIPPLIVVTALLESSDLVFARVLQRIASTLSMDAIGHVAMILLLGWIGMGWLRAVGGNVMGASVEAPRSPGLSFATVGVPIYALMAVLLLFVATQARVLFGGEEFLRQTAGLTAANYARDGFFQLIAASMVVIGTLVVTDWLLTMDANGRRRYQRAGVVLLVLVAILLFSAATRIWLYVREFGLSVDRGFAVTAILLVLAMLVTFGMTTLRGNTSRFAPSALAVMVAWVALLNVTNIEGIVVRQNIARAVTGKEFDAAYHARLSADALPTLLSNAHRLSPANCELLRNELVATWSGRLAERAKTGDGWQSLDLPLTRALQWLESGAHTSCTAP